MRYHAIASAVLLWAAGCGSVVPGDGQGGSSITILRSDDRFDLISGDISPNGRFVAQVNWSSGNLQLLDLTTGEGRDLTVGGYAGGYAWTSAFSPDGGRLAYAWYVDSVNSHELRVMDLASGESRVLVPADRERYYLDPVDWSGAGGGILVATQVADRTWQLALVDVVDGSLRVLRALDWQAPGGGHDQAYPDADLSPDERYLAWDYPSHPESSTRDVFMAPLDGGPVTPIVSGPASDRLLGWLPDGSGILFYSDRHGTPSIWRQDIRNGLAVGDSRLVHRDVDALMPLGFTTQGYVFGVGIEAERVHLAPVTWDRPIDAAAGRPLHGRPARQSLAFDFSPDGARVAYTTKEHLPNPVEMLVIATVDGQVERSIPLTPALHASNGTLRWVAENRVYLFAYERGTDGIFEISIPDGSFRRVELPASIGRGAFKWFDAAPGGRILFMASGGRLVGVDARTGTPRYFGEAGALRASVAISPDGRELAYLTRDRASGRFDLRVMDVGGGPPRTVHRASQGRLRPPVAWTADGSRILFGVEADSGPRAVWSVETSGMGGAPLLDGCCQENHVRLDRRGRMAAFVAGTNRADVRLLTGY